MVRVRQFLEQNAHSSLCSFAKMPNGKCDNYNLKWDRLCSNMSCINLSGYIGHMTIYI